MRSVKFLAFSILAFAMTGCTCKTALTTGGPGSEIPVAQGEGPLKDVHFGFDSYKLDTTAKGILNGNAAWLQQNAGQRVQIEGHCDERGTNEYNMVLGANRARSTMDYLRSSGIDASRMSTVSYGEELPLDPRHTEEAWAKNRRAHFNLDVK
jgi:peptidoglycan-associated lipoprotein